MAITQERIQQRASGGSSATSGSFTHGAGFTATMDGRITHLATYHWADGTFHAQGQTHPLSLWTNAGVKLAHVDFICPGINLLFGDRMEPDPQTGSPEPRVYFGWYEVPLPTPYDIVSGTTYRVSGAQAAYSYYSTPAPASLAPHLTVYQSGFYVAGYDVFPTTAQANNYYPVDVVAEFGTAGAGPRSYAVVL